MILENIVQMINPVQMIKAALYEMYWSWFLRFFLVSERASYHYLKRLFKAREIVRNSWV